MVNILVIEDDVDVIAMFEHYSGARDHSTTILTNLSDVRSYLELVGNSHDVIICDLKLPSVGGAVDEDVSFGVQALGLLRAAAPGTPVIVFSAFGTVDLVAEMMEEAHQQDVYGENVPIPMLRFKKKSDASQTLALIDEITAHLAKLRGIEIDGDLASTNYRTAIRIYARRRDGAMVHFRKLAGGLSGAITGIATVSDLNGSAVSRVVAKFTDLDEAVDEKSRYQRHIAGRLAASTYADLSDQVLAGCGPAAGLFYSVASDYGQDLFTLIAADDEQAALVVERLRQYSEPWVLGVAQSGKNWADVRRVLIRDDVYEDVRSAHPIVEIIPDTPIQSLWTSQHGDLHSGNVLVDEAARPVFIDYGRSGFGPAVLDPITLELSLVFHPDSPIKGGTWPSLSQLDDWEDLDAFLVDCPKPHFIKACRSWSEGVRTGRREWSATVNAYCLRNLRYPRADVQRLLRLQAASAGWLSAT